MLYNGGLRIPIFLASLVVSAEALLVCGIALSVDTDARIRATVAAGETIVAAVEHYRRDHGKLPATLEQLVPRYVAVLPKPEYGAPEWQFEAASADQAQADTPLRIALDLGATVDRRAAGRQVLSLSVRLDPANPGSRFRRSSSGCWQLPEFPKCW